MPCLGYNLGNLIPVLERQSQFPVFEQQRLQVLLTHESLRWFFIDSLNNAFGRGEERGGKNRRVYRTKNTITFETVDIAFKLIKNACIAPTTLNRLYEVKIVDEIYYGYTITSMASDSNSNSNSNNEVSCRNKAC